ncbi:MAG: hypothetical protein M1829_005078 [Trizodia sp. TS-e1964]|nr:MAG: hypothetical protein M1829_005078 [Trizodia sp. TS-e1964]
MSTPPAPPTIFLLSLERQSFFDEQYARFLDALATRATVHRASKASAALKYLQESTPPRAILLTDAALAHIKSKCANSPQHAVLAAVRAYVRPSDLTKFLQEAWGTRWASGTYVRTTLHLQMRMLRVFGPALPENYSQKALFLKNVARKEALYLPDEQSRVESLVFPPDPIADASQCPVVLGEVGRGWLGYIRDVNSEEETEAVIFAMCGL